MRRGINELEQKIRKDTSDSGDRQHNLDTLDLLNSRFNFPCSQRKRTQRDAGSGDNKLIKATTSLKGERQKSAVLPAQDKTNHYQKSKTILTHNIVDQFLLPPSDKKNCRLYTKSGHHLSNAGDAGNFPFKLTRSGNLKVSSEQVVFESKKLSVLVANPHRTQIQVYSEDSSQVLQKKSMAYESEPFYKHSAMDAILSQSGISDLGSIIAKTPMRGTNKVSSEYEGKDQSEILDPELNLSRLGYTGNEPIDWNKVDLQEKTDLCTELYQRVAQKKNADCKVQIGQVEFNCHLIVLQCYSKLFDNYIAIKKVDIPEDKCTPQSFSFIYDWMLQEKRQCVTGLNRENVLDIFNSAKFLKIKDLEEQCWGFIDNIDIFNEDTAFLLYVDAKIKNVEEVRELMAPRIQNFFLILVSSQDWLELEIEDVKYLLKSNYIKINCEMEVFMSAVRWLKYDWSNRDKYKEDVFSCVRFGDIAAWQLIDIKRNPESPEFMELARDPAICRLIDDGLAYAIINHYYGQDHSDFQTWNSLLGLQEPAPRNWSGKDKHYFCYKEFLIYLDKYRKEHLIEKNRPRYNNDKKVCGISGHLNTVDEPLVPSMDDFLAKKKSRQKIFCKLRLSNLKPLNETADDEECRNVKKMFTPTQNSLAQTSLNRFSRSFISLNPKKLLQESTLFLADRETILIFGGVDLYNKEFGTEPNTGDKVLQYLPDSNNWVIVGSMPEPRTHHSIGFLKGLIYIVGGSDPRKDDVTKKQRVVDTVWSFDPANQNWFSETSLGMRRKNFGLVMNHHNIYAIGGYNDKQMPLATVEKFNFQQRVWSFVASMRFPRAGFGCAKYRNCIWAAGGCGESKNSQFLDVVESYNLKNDQWTRIKKLNTPRSFSTLFVMSDRLYLIGGVESIFKNTKSSCSMAYVDTWNTTSLKWESFLKLTIPRHGHAVAYIGTQIFIIGGVTTSYMKCLSDVECFGAQRKIWLKGVPNIPLPLSGHAAVTLPPATLISNE